MASPSFQRRWGIPRKLHVRPVSAEEERQLRRLARARNALAAVVQRARVIVYMLDHPGASAKAAGQAAGFRWTRGPYWVKRFHREGMAGLLDRMRAGRFRRDLYERLRGHEVRVPALRERREDVRWLVDHFVRRACEGVRQVVMGRRGGMCGGCMGRGMVGCVAEEFYEALVGYGWPGNVRELRQVVEAAVAEAPGQVLRVAHVPERVRAARGGSGGEEELRLEEVVRRHIERVLEMTGYNQSRAAQLLGIPRTTLQSKMKKLGIRMP